VEAWGELLERLGRGLGVGDLLALVSTRRGSLAWHPRLARLPEQLAALAPGALVALFPPGPGLAALDDTGPLAHAVEPRRVVRLESMSFSAAVGRLMEGVFDDETARHLANVVGAQRGAVLVGAGAGRGASPRAAEGAGPAELLLGVSRHGWSSLARGTPPASSSCW
jgi:hypothetical protein